MKVKSRLPVPSIATSGRWNKRADGEWGFDLDDPPKYGDNEEANAALTDAAVSGRLNSGGISDEDDENEHSNDQKTINVGDNVYSNQNSTNLITKADHLIQNKMNSQQSTSNDQDKTVTRATSDLVSSEPIPPIHLVLRMRDEKKELQDIKFDFLPNKDTVEEISHELVNAKLIDAIDMVAVSLNLTKLLENSSISPISFQLVKINFF